MVNSRWQMLCFDYDGYFYKYTRLLMANNKPCLVRNLICIHSRRTRRMKSSGCVEEEAQIMEAIQGNDFEYRINTFHCFVFLLLLNAKTV